MDQFITQFYPVDTENDKFLNDFWLVEHSKSGYLVKLNWKWKVFCEPSKPE